MMIMRLLDVQVCPEFARRENSARRAEVVTSVESSTMYGSEPPSSKTAFFRWRPACSPTADPARSEPVNETPWMRGTAKIVESMWWGAYKLMLDRESRRG